MIIGLSGEAGVGKDTVGQCLVETYGFRRTALADPLKRIAKEVYDFTDEQLWGPSQFRNMPDSRYPRTRSDGSVDYLTPRECLQLLGTEFGRVCYPNTWIDLGMRRANQLLTQENAKGVVFTDVRFKNEIDGLKGLGAKVVRIVRPTGGLVGQAGTHASEMEQKAIPDSAFDYVLVNDGPLDLLGEKIAVMMNTLRQQ